jgi:hypothetical protein
MWSNAAPVIAIYPSYGALNKIWLSLVHVSLPSSKSQSQQSAAIPHLRATETPVSKLSPVAIIVFTLHRCNY